MNIGDFFQLERTFECNRKARNALSARRPDQPFRLPLRSARIQSLKEMLLIFMLRAMLRASSSTDRLLSSMSNNAGDLSAHSRPSTAYSRRRSQYAGGPARRGKIILITIRRARYEVHEDALLRSLFRLSGHSRRRPGFISRSRCSLSLSYGGRGGTDVDQPRNSQNRSPWSDQVHIYCMSRQAGHLISRVLAFRDRCSMTELDRIRGYLQGLRPARRRPSLAPPFHHGMVSRLRNYFLTGLVLSDPLYITVGLTWGLNWVDDLVRPYHSVAYRPRPLSAGKIPGTGSFWLVGFDAARRLPDGEFRRPQAGRASENILNRMPVVRPLYKSLKQIFETLFGKADLRSFRRGRLDRVPRPACGPLIFVSNPASADIDGIGSRRRARRRLHALQRPIRRQVSFLCAAPVTSSSYSHRDGERR